MAEGVGELTERSSSRKDLAYGLGLFFITLASRAPFRSQILYHWDSVNFALALEHFDVRLHQPHPPGYVLYVLLGRAFDVLFSNPNTSLVWISVLFSGLAVSAIFWLGRAMFGRQTGLTAAAMALTSPLFWFHGEVALSYITEAFFVTAFALCCYRQMAGDKRYILPAATLLGVAGGFRQNALVLLLPLWLFSLMRLRWRQRLMAAATLLLIVGAWMTAMILLSGGIANYWQAVGSQTRGNLAISVAGSGSNLAINVLRLTTYGFYALTLGLGLVPLAFLWFARHRCEWAGQLRWQVLGVWLVPSLAFYALFVQQAGYTFTFMPAALVVLSSFLVEMRSELALRWRGGRQMDCAVVALLLSSNVAFFLCAPPFLFGQRRQLLNTPSWRSIQARNITVKEKLSYIGDHFAPGNTAVLAGRFNFRLPDYYLREYRVPSLSHQAVGDPRAITLADEVRFLVLFDEDVSLANAGGLPLEQVSLAAGAKLRWLERSQGKQFIVSASGVSVKPAEPTDDSDR